MKLTKVALAIASVLAISAGSVQAGQINSSSTTLATEVIWSNSQVVRAPSNAYTFSGDVDARTNEQRLQLQYTLGSGEWANGAGQLVPTAGLSVDLLAAGVLQATYKDATDTNRIALPTGTTVFAFMANNNRTLVLNVTIPANAANLLRGTIWTVNPAATVGTDNVGITKLFDVAQATACVAPDRSVDINFKHFTNHDGTPTVQTLAAPDAEHLRVGSTNDARFLNFTQNLRFDFTRAVTSSQVNAAALRTTFIPVATPPVYVGVAAPAIQVHTMGTVDLNRRAIGLDLDYTNIYGKGLALADFDVSLGAWVQSGVIDATTLTVKVDGNQAKGSKILLVDSTGIVAQTTALAADAATSTVTVSTAALMARVAAGVTVLYVVDGANVIPDQGDFAVTATLGKDRPLVAGNEAAEQDNVCAAPLTGLGNSGIKIDVRNYASFAKFGSAGPATSLRIINNSETRSADLYAQMIYADGTYGAWGQLPNLAPRAVLNISNKDLEAAMTNAPAASNPFGGSAVYTSTPGSAVVGTGAAGVGDRVRIISNTGSTLRVQSYMVVGNTVLDTSNGQGVDFENTAANRAPTADAQPLSQDAINGLSRN